MENKGGGGGGGLFNMSEGRENSYQLIDGNIRSDGCPSSIFVTDVVKQHGTSLLHHDGLIVFRVLVRARAS